MPFLPFPLFFSLPCKPPYPCHLCPQALQKLVHAYLVSHATNLPINKVMLIAVMPWSANRWKAGCPSAIKSARAEAWTLLVAHYFSDDMEEVSTRVMLTLEGRISVCSEGRNRYLGGDRGECKFLYMTRASSVQRSLTWTTAQWFN